MKSSKVKSSNTEIFTEYAAFGRKFGGDWVKIDVLRPNVEFAYKDIKQYLKLRTVDYDEYGVRKRTTIVTHTDWEDDWEDTED